VKGDGLGFVLNGDGIVCIDLDHCFDGVPSVQAQAVLDLFPDTYVEVSPSGTGLHIWGFAPLLKGRRFTLNGLSVEVYPSGRYMTVTGNAVNSSSFADLDLSQILP
jgi:primase-polymerase (primpol)-like protein